jgi:hypothetical protein
MHTGKADSSLDIIVELIFLEYIQDRELFSLYQEPLFYRKLRKWVLDGLEEVGKIKKKEGELLAALPKRGMSRLR